MMYVLVVQKAIKLTCCRLLHITLMDFKFNTDALEKSGFPWAFVCLINKLTTAYL